MNARTDVHHLTEQELADRLGVSVKTVRGWRMRGGGEAMKALTAFIIGCVLGATTAHVAQNHAQGTKDASGGAEKRIAPEGIAWTYTADSIPPTWDYEVAEL